MAMNEAKESFGKMLRWTEQPKDAEQAEKTVFIGTAVQGFYVAKRDGVGKNDSTVYEILLANGEKYSFWGSGLLDGKFQNIPLNCEVRVTCLGTAQPKTSGGRAYLNFKVEFDKDSIKPANLTEVATDTAAPAAATVPTSAVAAPVPTAPVAAPVPVAPAPVAPVAAPVAAPVPTAPVAAPVAAPVPTAAPVEPVAQQPAPAAPAAGDGF